MLKLGIIGYPLGHSLSPVMHKAALDYLGIEGSYEIIETPPEDLFNAIKFLKTRDFKGFNVTIPLKVWIVPLLNEVDEYANITGAVNTVSISENKDMKGYNTDIYGFIEAIPQDIRDSLKHKKAAVFGSGGAARAVCAGLGMLGVNEINIYARNVEKSLKLKDAITENFPDIKVLTKEYNEFADLSYASILVNTTPVGMEGANEDISPVNKNSIQSLPDNALVYDLIYKPRKTKMLQYARKRDLYTLDGLEMLVLQGAKGLTIWTGQEAPVEIMREALLKSLQSG